MNTTIFVNEVIEELRERNPRFHEAAYLFVISALHHVMDGLPARRHISACELAEGVRELALDRFGPMSRSVLEYWGIQSTGDLGRVVFALVECGILARQEDDRIGAFEDLFDFEEVFERNYPWGSSL